MVPNPNHPHSFPKGPYSEYLSRSILYCDPNQSNQQPPSFFAFSLQLFPSFTVLLLLVAFSFLLHPHYLPSSSSLQSSTVQALPIRATSSASLIPFAFVFLAPP